MKHICRLFGKADIKEPVILELINTEEMQRLKGIDQAGYSASFFPNSFHSRYEHSVGCYLLLRKFGASIEEQIAGLIHDVSHAVFSHCIDYALSGGSETKQSYQDNIFEKYILNSNIPAILEKYGYDAGYIANERNFPLQENNLPDLCADRIDYSLRNAIAFGEINRREALEVINNMKVVNNHWAFTNQDTAYKYAKLFSYLNKKYWAGINSAAMFRSVGDYLKHALKSKYITKEDLFTTDKIVIDKINKNLTEDFLLQKLFGKMSNAVKYKNSKKDYESKVMCKSRIIDPLVIIGKFKTGRVSGIFPEWKIEVEKESQPKEYFLKYLSD